MKLWTGFSCIRTASISGILWRR